MTGNLPSAPLQTTLLRVDEPAALPAALPALGFKQPRPTLVIIGGASKLSDADFAKVTQLFTGVIAPFAQDRQLTVVDGGTDAGVMRLIGQGRASIDGDFPLVGVAPVGLVDLPEYADGASAESCPLEPHHTHCLLVPGDQWGDESWWMAAVATQLAGSCGSAAVVVNGGEITWKDAAAHAEAGRPLLVIAGSGRTADIIAAAARGEAADPRATQLVATHKLQVVELAQPEALKDRLNDIF
ncbi:MAG: hypothetical protein AAF289_00530 [Cyanobacteria bacterium P01_A01_bin.135]